MSAWELPTSTVVNGTEYEIRSDFRAALDILTLFDDAELTEGERGSLCMEIFYPAFGEMPNEDYKDAAEYLSWFISGGEVRGKKPKSKIADWNKDFPLIIGPVNRVLGYEARSVGYDFASNTGGLHWWTFLGAYLEVGECLFAQVVAIRNKLAKHKKLEKHEREFYRENRDLIDLKPSATSEEEEIFASYFKG